MNSLMLIVLAMAALFFYQIGSTFLAFLVLIVLVVMMLSSQGGGEAAMGGGHGGGVPNPYVINQSGSVWPTKTKFEFRPNYPGDPDGDEWISGKAGQWFLFFGNAAKSLFGLNRSDTSRDKFYEKYSH